MSASVSSPLLGKSRGERGGSSMDGWQVSEIAGLLTYAEFVFQVGLSRLRSQASW